jgi:hypothetical protein
MSDDGREGLIDYDIFDCEEFRAINFIGMSREEARGHLRRLFQGDVYGLFSHCRYECDKLAHVVMFEIREDRVFNYHWYTPDGVIQGPPKDPSSFVRKCESQERHFG